ncbi:NYN domain [Corynebacterium diphtheriae]|nr:NYN domain [Corynebacterium diphtheriae]
MLERTQVFVDTSYLLASFYNSWEIGARAQLEIDLPEVVATLDNMIHNQLGQPVHRQFWYDGIPESGPHRYQRALRTCDGVQLRAGQLIEWGERRTQKAVDTRLVADMVLAGIRREFTDIVLVSGDADMIPGVQEAVNAGVRVHLYGFGWDSMSSALRHACDSTTILDPREDFADCMQLEILEGPLPPVVRNPDEEGEEGEFPTAAAEAAADTTVTTGTTDTEATPPVPTPEQVAEKNQREVPTAPIPCPQRPGEPALSEEDCMAEIPAKMPNPVAPKPGAHLPVETPAPAPTATPAPTPSSRTVRVTSTVEESLEVRVSNSAEPNVEAEEADAPATPRPAPNPSMMAPRRKLRSRYVPLPNEVWASAGYQTPFDVGQQYALWWFDNAATPEQRDSAHLLSGGGLPPEIDRPLLQFACETLHEYTLTEAQRVGLRDGFHSGIRGVLINNQNS